MILEGNQRGGGRNLALHLLKEENEHVEVSDMRGFISPDLPGAFKEIYAASRVTKAKQYLYSLSLNPPQQENVPTEVFEEAISRVEHALGLAKQPRAIVFHEKNGRRHAHAVWSRIDTKEGKAVHLPYTKRKLMDISRSLFLENGWKMPDGMMRSEARDPRNFSHAEWQQAQRMDRDPREIKGELQDCWAVSDTQTALTQALLERGYILAQGDRRAFVAVDFLGGIYSIAKSTNQKTRDVLSRITESYLLPGVDEARGKWSQQQRVRMTELREAHKEAIRERYDLLNERKTSLTRKHAEERDALIQRQENRRQITLKQGQARFRKGLLGLFDRMTGKYRKLFLKIETEVRKDAVRDQDQRDALAFSQLEEKRRLNSRVRRLLALTRNRRRKHTRLSQEYAARLENETASKPRRPRSRRPGR